MGGGDLNLKKSWHPQTRENQEKLWLARQSKSEEDKKLAILRKELQKLQRKNGTTVKADRIDWMYSGSSASQKTNIQEEYLLGKRKIVEIETDSEKSASLDIKAGHIHDRAGNSPLSTYDMDQKLREDPLSIIKKKERQLAQRLNSNPIQMKRRQLAASIRSNMNASATSISTASPIKR